MITGTKCGNRAVSARESLAVSDEEVELRGGEHSGAETVMGVKELFTNQSVKQFAESQTPPGTLLILFFFFLWHLELEKGSTFPNGSEQKR